MKSTENESAPRETAEGRKERQEELYTSGECWLLPVGILVLAVVYAIVQGFSQGGTFAGWL